jgi:ABC-type lipoprotein export system ATPase subunit
VNNLFTIKDLSCQYKANAYPVLEIEELNIEEGSVVFMVGASGVGKSTLLETLGIMNNTINKRPQSKIWFNQNGDVYDLIEIWKKREGHLAKFRRKYLSFIFQNTNLFNNLTAFQNACISQVIQGKKYDASELKAKQILKTMFDDDVVMDIINGKKNTELSGGQQQRLAFVRAIVADYKVLFADEPTGNLDHASADNLMCQLTANVKESGRTGVIVTHDIDLALKYGDVIVIIFKCIESKDDEKRVYGKIDRKSVFRKNGNKWEGDDLNVLNTREMNIYLKSQLS